MDNRIRTTEPTLKVIRDTGRALPLIEAGEVAVALGAEPTVERLEPGLAPITLFAVRQKIAERLHSSGGRPSLSGANRRVKIPLGDREWLELEEVAAAISSSGFAPSAGQVASVLLTLSLDVVAPLVSGSDDASRTSLARALADHLAVEPTTDPTDHSG